MAKYRVNWLIKGLVPGIKYLKPGETVELDPQAAARGLEVGSLSVVMTKPAAPAAGDGAPAGSDAGGAGSGAGTTGSGDAEMDLDKMNKGQLVKLAQDSLGLALDINLSKKDLLAAIRNAMASK